MAHWSQTKLGQISQIYSGFAFRSQDLGDHGIPVVKIANIQNKRVSPECPDHFPEKLYTDKLNRFLLHPDDTLIAMTGAGSVGKVGKMPRNSGRFLVNQRVAIVRPDSSACDPAFVYFALSQDHYEKQLYGLGLGAGQPNVSAKQISELELPFPPLPVQQRIAGILSAYDELIENSQRRIRILEAMARALYREWFVHYRFPGHENHPRVASPLGDIPKGWEVKRLGDVAEVNRAQINTRTAPEELRYIDISSVSPGQIDSVTTYTFAEAPGRARRLVQHGDVLWSCVRPNRRSHAQVMHPEPNTIASTGFAVLTGTKVPFTFLYFATTTDDFVGYLTNNATGAAYPAVTAATFEKADLLIPPTPLLKNFGAATIPMAEEIHTLHRQIQNLRRTRDLLLPRLLSGQVELKPDAA